MTGQQTTDSGSVTAGGRSPALAEQASAMFDGELPAAECELLARRLSSDARLQRQWSRHALIGAAMRGEPLAVQREPHVLRDSVAVRVRAELNSDGAASVSADSSSELLPPAAGHRSVRWARPLAGVGIAAGVAALSIFWVQGSVESPVAAPAATLASSGAVVNEITAPGAGVPVAAPGSEVVLAPPSSLVANSVRRESTEPESYVVPLPATGSGGIASTQLANYVVAHSEFSGALTRHGALAALVTAEALPAAPIEAGDTAQAAPAPAVPATGGGR